MGALIYDFVWESTLGFSKMYDFVMNDEKS